MKAKALTVIGLLLATAGSCLAMEFNYSFGYQTNGTKMVFSTAPGAKDEFDRETSLSLPQPSNPYHACFYNVNGVNKWDGPTGWYFDDVRSPLVPGQKRVMDNIYVWAESGAPIQNIYLYPYYNGLSSGLTYKLSLLSVPAGITYNGPREWGPNHENIILPFYSTDDGTTGYRFKAEITAVPEPSSLIALLGGLAAISGTVSRRRR